MSRFWQSNGLLLLLFVVIFFIESISDMMLID